MTTATPDDAMRLMAKPYHAIVELVQKSYGENPPMQHWADEMMQIYAPGLVRKLMPPLFSTKPSGRMIVSTRDF